jgi:two-component system CheB/CheR fusion protein
LTKKTKKPTTKIKAKKQNQIPTKPNPQTDDIVKTNFPIIGIGASAGGLTAFKSFFSGLSQNKKPDMAFILIQHLDPKHKSELAEIIESYTYLPVLLITDGMVIQPNFVYVIPPNKELAILNGTLQLLEPTAAGGQRMPIDFFFQTLAQDQREKAVGIILSGAGSDGTSGVSAIKKEGGIIMVQRPDTAEFDSMPRNAIATDLVDFELEPIEMPNLLITLCNKNHLQLPRPLITQSPMTEKELKTIFILLRSQTNHDFSLYKPNTIYRRIERRLAVNKIDSLSDYVKFLQKSTTEVEALFRDLLIGVTNFFRDIDSFKTIEDVVIKKIADNNTIDNSIRVWVPACSTGEEAYSIAILIHEFQETTKQNLKVQIFATDIDSRAIEIARAGLYSTTISENIPPERLSRYFTVEPNGSYYRIHKVIRDMLVFSEQNLIRDPPFSKLDLISCRNLLIYLGDELQKKIIPLFHYALKPEGILFLGNFETIGEWTNLFSVLDRKSKLYQRKEELKQSTKSKYLPLMIGAEMQPLGLGNKTQSISKLPTREIAEHAILHQATPAAALVTANGNILYLHGRTGMFLEPTSGENGASNILKMAREGLKRDLTTALHKASRMTDAVVRLTDLSVKTNGHFTLVNLSVLKVLSNQPAILKNPLFLVVFEHSASPEIATTHATIPVSKNGKKKNAKDSDTRISWLEKELQIKEEYLQTTIEELETSTEELKTSNEKLQSVNEELQSTNEELETSKEELQSVNEELTTVNMELRGKVGDLTQTNNDITNLLAGTGIATLFVDLKLCIVRFTPITTNIINLINSDIGRPVSDLVYNLVSYHNLSTDIQTVLDTLIPKEFQVQTLAGVWYTLRIQPYRTIENVVEGAVLTFVDTSEAMNAKLALEEYEKHLNQVIENTGVFIFNQDQDLRYTWVHNSQMFFKNKAVIGKSDADLLSKDDAKMLNVIKSRVIESSEPAHEKMQLTIHEKKCFYDITIKPNYDNFGRVNGIMGVIIYLPNGTHKPN